MKIYYVIILFAFFTLENGCSQRHNQEIDSNKIKTSQIDSSLIGQELEKVMKTLNVDSTKLIPFDEPPMILRGVWGFLPDSTELILYVDRTMGHYYKEIKNKKIIGLACGYANGQTKYIGKFIQYYQVGKQRDNEK